jgi:hypothetical protein
LESRPFNANAVSPVADGDAFALSESEAHTAQTLLDEEEGNNHFPAMIPQWASVLKVT